MISGIIDEHAPRPVDGDEDNDSDVYNPTPEEQRALKKVDKFFKKAKKWRSNYDKEWMDNYKFFRGQQWREQRPSYRHSEVINMVFQTIQSMVPILTDARPKFEFLPQNPDDQEFASIINEVCEADWQKNSWQDVITELLYDSHIYGVGFVGLYKKLSDGEVTQDLTFKTEDPLYCYPDPNCFDINDERCHEFLHAEPLDVELIKRLYPEKGKYVRGDLEDLTTYEKTDIDGYSRLKLPIDNTKSMRESGGSIDTINVTRALVKTYYGHDDSVEEIESVDESGMPVFERVKKYPRGRKIVVAGNIVLEDGPLEYEDGKIPLARLQNYILPREFYGISEIEQVKGPQRIFNKLISFALDVLTLMGNPVWILSSDSAVDGDNLINKPGLVIEKSPGSEVRREEGVQLQPYVLQLIDRMREWFDGLTGATDVSRGVQPGGVTAAAAIADLQEAAQTRIRLKSRNLDGVLQKVGQMYVSRTMQFRDTPDMIRVTDNQGASKYFKFHIENQENGMGGLKKVAVIQNYNQNPENGEYALDPMVKQIEVKGVLDVKVQTGTSLAFRKNQDKQDAKELFQMQVIDAEELLKRMEYPNYQAVMQRMQEQQAAAAQRAAAAQGAPTAPPVQ